MGPPMLVWVDRQMDRCVIVVWEETEWCSLPKIDSRSRNSEGVEHAAIVAFF